MQCFAPVRLCTARQCSRYRAGPAPLPPWPRLDDADQFALSDVKGHQPVRGEIPPSQPDLGAALGQSPGLGPELIAGTYVRKDSTGRRADDGYVHRGQGPRGALQGQGPEHTDGVCTTDGTHCARQQVVGSVDAGNRWKTSAGGYGPRSKR